MNSNKNKSRENGSRYHKKQTATNSMNDKFTIYAQMKMHYPNFSVQDNRYQINNNKNQVKSHSLIQQNREEERDSQKISKLKEILKSVLYQQQQQNSYPSQSRNFQKVCQPNLQFNQILQKQYSQNLKLDPLSKQSTYKNSHTKNNIKSSLQSKVHQTSNQMMETDNLNLQMPSDSQTTGRYHKSFNYNQKLDILKKNLKIISEKSYNHEDRNERYELEGLRSAKFSKQLNKRPENLYQCYSQVLSRKKSAQKQIPKNSSASISLPISNAQYFQQKAVKSIISEKQFGKKSSSQINRSQGYKQQIINPIKNNAENNSKIQRRQEQKISQIYFQQKIRHNESKEDKNFFKEQSNLTDRIVASNSMSESIISQYKKEEDNHLKMKNRKEEFIAVSDRFLPKQKTRKVTPVKMNQSNNQQYKIFAPTLELNKFVKKDKINERKQSNLQKKNPKNSNKYGVAQRERLNRSKSTTNNKVDSRSSSNTRAKNKNANASFQEKRLSDKYKQQNHVNGYKQSGVSKNLIDKNYTNIYFQKNGKNIHEAYPKVPVISHKLLLPRIHRSSISRVLQIEQNLSFIFYSASSDYQISRFEQKIIDNLSSHKIQYPYRHCGGVTDLLIDNHQRYLVSSGKDLYLKIALLQENDNSEQKCTLFHSNRLAHVAQKLIHIDNQTIGLGSRQGFSIYDISKNQIIRQIDYLLSSPHTLMESKSNNILIGNRKCLQSVDIRCRNPFQQIVAYKGVQIDKWLIDSNSEYNYASASYSGQKKYFNIFDKRKPEIFTLSEEISFQIEDYGWLKNGNQLLLLSTDGAIQITKRWQQKINMRNSSQKSEKILQTIINLNQLEFFQANKIDILNSKCFTIGNKKGDLIVLQFQNFDSQLL